MLPKMEQPKMIPITIKRYCPTCGNEIKERIEYSAYSQVYRSQEDNMYNFLLNQDFSKNLIKFKYEHSVRAFIVEWFLKCPKCKMRFEVKEYWDGYKNIEKWLEGLNDKNSTDQ